jgi:hypothetical protein
MKFTGILTGAMALIAAASPLQARSTIETDSDAGGSGGGSYLQCVPYARTVTGIRIFGDAHTWWGQAQGRYARGDRPRVGAVMNLRPHGNSRLGHVAAVSRVIDSRTILIRHANWSRRGGIEDNVRAIDVSPGNDWSAVRVWYGPAGQLGSSHWPLYGFIYNEKPGRERKPERARTDRESRSPRAASMDDPIGAIIAARR